jgi:uncharacterized membrane protein YGL010W
VQYTGQPDIPAKTKDANTRQAGASTRYRHYRAGASPLYHPFAMLGNRTNEQWIAQYATSHQHPVNRACHTLGIPTILLSVLFFLASIFVHRLWPYALGLFVIGWIFQFIGHAFEGKPPEFFQDWRFLFVGVRWWWAKINGRA